MWPDLFVYLLKSTLTTDQFVKIIRHIALKTFKTHLLALVLLISSQAARILCQTKTFFTYEHRARTYSSTPTWFSLIYSYHKMCVCVTFYGHITSYQIYSNCVRESFRVANVLRKHRESSVIVFISRCCVSFCECTQINRQHAISWTVG